MDDIRDEIQATRTILRLDQPQSSVEPHATAQFILFLPLFLLPLHISPVKHVGLGDLDRTKMLR